MSYQILIVDDEPLARQVIREYIDKLMADAEITEADDAIEAQRILGDRTVDILFLDINMPLMTGLELASTQETSTLTIFTTAYAEHAVEAFELAAFDYLVKPISFARFQKSFRRVVDHLASDQSAKTEWVMIKEGKRMYKVLHGEILYLQAYGDYVKIYTPEKTYLMKTKLSAIGQELPCQFARSHRSYVINIEKIAYVEGNHVVINDEKIPISDGYRAELLNRL